MLLLVIILYLLTLQVVTILLLVANTPHEPAVISLMREYIEEANTAMLSNDYRKAATFVRLAHYNEQCFTVNEDGEIKVKASKWETWRPKY